MGRIGEVHDVQEAADALKVLAEVVRLAVRGEVALVASAARQVDAGLQNRVATVGGRRHKPQNSTQLFWPTARRPR